MLDEILTYHESPEDPEFVTGVMKGIQRQQTMRRLILIGSGLVGAAFGLVGAVMIGQSFNHIISGTHILPVSVSLVGAAAFMAWLFNDEVTATG